MKQYYEVFDGLFRVVNPGLFQYLQVGERRRFDVVAWRGDRSLPLQVAAVALRSVLRHRHARQALGSLPLRGNEVLVPHRTRYSETAAAGDCEDVDRGVYRVAHL